MKLPVWSEKRPRERWCRDLSHAATDQLDVLRVRSFDRADSTTDVKPFMAHQVSNHFKNPVSQ